MVLGAGLIPVIKGVANTAITAGGNIAGSVSNIFGGPTYKQTGFMQDKYDFRQLVFPNNIGQEDMGHYMVININVPVHYSANPAQAPRRGANSLQNGPFGDMLPGNFSKLDVLRFGKLSSNQAFPDARQAEKFAIPRYTRRIAQSIALHMPSQVTFMTQNAYEEISLTAMVGSIGAGAIQAATAGISAGFGGAATAAIGGWIAGGVTSGIGGVIGAGAKLAKYPINPRIEIVYSNTALRSYVFELLLGPTSPEESKNIEQIIGQLRFHAAPELDPKTAGLTFIPPAEFDITFFNKGEENIHMPRINTCVLRRIDVDYSPVGGAFATFSNGHPVAVRLSMEFMELEILHKLRIAQGF